MLLTGVIPMMTRTLISAALVALGSWGCGGSSSSGNTLQVVSGAPSQATPAPTVDLIFGLAPVPSLLSALGGNIIGGTDGGVLRGSALLPDTFGPMTVAGTGTDPSTTGPVSFIARRSGGGALVQGQNGLFETTSGFLLFSPLTASVNSDHPTTFDALGSGSAEEIWFNTASGVLHASGGQLQSVTLAGVTSTPDGVVAAGPGQAIVMASGTAYLVDLGAQQVSPVGQNLGALNGFDRADDGSVYLATAAGLFVRTRAGAITLYTLAASGAAATPVLSVSAANGAVLAVTSQQLVQLSSSGPVAIAGLDGGQAGWSVAADQNGDGWVIDQGQLLHVRSGQAVSFARDVKPFFDKHCTVCHWTSSSGTTANGAPPTNFDDYATAQGVAPTALKRLEADGTTPMPPPSFNDPLAPSDYAVVIQWIEQGYPP